MQKLNIKRVKHNTERLLQIEVIAAFLLFMMLITVTAGFMTSADSVINVFTIVSRIFMVRWIKRFLKQVLNISNNI